jgi:uncharacterized protein
MKAALALLLIYVGTFLVAIQGGSSSAVQAAAQNTSSKQTAATSTPSVDPAKDADIRALLELVGAHDQVQDSVNRTAEQYREKLLQSVPENKESQAFVNTVITAYEKKFDVDAVTDQLILIYDKHYTDEEIKGLLQFYGSSLGQKVANESLKISREIQDVTRATAMKAVKDALQETKQENPGVGQNAKLGNGSPRRLQQRRAPQPDAAQQAAQQVQP